MKDIVSKLLNLLRKVKVEKFSARLVNFDKDGSKNSAAVELGKLSFDEIGSVMDKTLSVDVPFIHKGKARLLNARTRLLKSQKDYIVLDGRPVEGDVDFDLVYKWFNLVLNIEISFVEDGVKKQLVLTTSLGYGFGVKELLAIAKR